METVLLDICCSHSSKIQTAKKQGDKKKRSILAGTQQINELNVSVQALKLTLPTLI